MSALKTEITKTDHKSQLLQLTAPVDGTLQQLAIHSEGGTPVQPLMAIVSNDYSAEVEAALENKDVGFVKPGMPAEIKVETFPFTRHGTIPAEVRCVSNDAVNDEQRGLMFPVRLRVTCSHIQVDERNVNLTAGMAMTAEIKTGSRRAIEYFLSPVIGVMDASLGER